MPIEVVFFDVGNTLLFPDHEKTLAPLWNRGIRPTEAQLFAAERVARQDMDLIVSQTRKVDLQYWETYYAHLLRTLNVTDISLRLELVNLARTSSNWRRMPPGTIEVLESMKRKYRLGVISNSDGHMAERLATVGLGKYFEHVIDSGNVGYEKPAPQIFQAALAAMSVAADRALYLGDIYSIDYLGAQKAGMRAILMDIAGVYAMRNEPRIESLDQLTEAISKI
ncbi:MAG TPA: HAD family hydrolase [Terriglobales bacterium]|jgi:HAD superfamily hydrolase (TIGR01509 family)|nr:HAD family hydrolase [Terriglobales bacterium]